MNSFLQGKKSLSAPPLRPPPGLSGGLTPACSKPRSLASSASAGAQPSVEVVKEGDKVVRLVVTCGCGERIEVECLYPVGS